MSPRPPVVPTIAPSRAIMLPASFAACGVLALALFVVLVGCGQILSLDAGDSVPANRNAILCSCDCDGPVDNAVPSANTIRAKEDDVVQLAGEGTANPFTATLGLGFGAHVGLRFQKLGLPPNADVTEAYIQFTAVFADGAPTNLEIFAVDSPNAEPFTAATNLTALNFINAPVPWPVKPWKANEFVEPERTEDLSALVEAIVKKQGYTPDSAIAFVITGTGRRFALAKDGATKFPAPSLVIKYTPRKYTKEFLACGNPSEATAVCTQKVQSNVTGIAQQCKLAKECTCTVKAAPDPHSFSAACNAPCDLKPLEDCSAEDIAKVTAATPSHPPVCVANSPLGSVLFQRLTSCEIQGTPNCPDLEDIGDNSCVSVRVFDDEAGDSLTRISTPRGRIEFAETPCSPGSRCYGMRHRVHIGDLTFSSGGFIGDLFEGDHTLVELSNVGASTVNVGVNNTGAGQFGGPQIKHSVRGRESGKDPVAVFKTGALDRPVNFSLPPQDETSWQSNGVCTLQGMVLKTEHLEMFANIKGKLVNQPPTAELDPDHTVECNVTGAAAFALDATWHDPDNNVASFGWFRGSRKGQFVGALPSVELEQPLTSANEPATPYFFKVIDTFGAYAEATTKVRVVDTTAPSITTSGNAQAECTGPNGTFVNITATASDVCDASPTLGNTGAPGGLLFPVGVTTVKWTAKDASTNEATALQTVTIKDTTPPTINSVTASPSSLWPPDHRMVPVTVTVSVSDVCDPKPTCQIVGPVTSNEPDNGLGDGDTAGDWQITGPLAAEVRSERSGTGTGRVYTLTVRCSDASGNTSLPKSVVVNVPKSQK